MLSEGVHSTADTGNQLLMLLGLKRGQKPPDAIHPFGHGQEVYFWGFVVAMMLFSLGGGVSIYEGIHRLQHGEPASNPLWNYVVLAIAAAAESVSLHFALEKFRARLLPGEDWWSAFRTSKDPSVFIVVAEDLAALAGIAVAAIGIFVEQMTGSTIPDAVAAIIIGFILAAVAVLMAVETHALLLGESADPEIVSGILKIVQKDPIVVNAHRPLTMHFGPNEIVVNMTVEFRSGASGEAILSAIENFESAIRRNFPRIRRIFIESESLRQRPA